jgi:hypothetical protein
VLITEVLTVAHVEDSIAARCCDPYTAVRVDGSTVKAVVGRGIHVTLLRGFTQKFVTCAAQ